jgi:uncharacterized membrane protein
VRGVRLVLAALIGAALALPAAAVAQTGSNPLAPGFPQPTVSVPTTSTTVAPTVQTTTTAGSGSGFSGNSTFIIAIAAIVVLGGISFFIWRDARRRAPTKSRAWAPGLEEGQRKGTKARAKPRKLSAAERRRRKRGRAR